MTMSEPRRCSDCTMRSHGILGQVPDDVFRRISCCMAPSRFPSRHRIFIEGNPGDRFACIREGVVKLSRTARNGRIQVLGLVGPGFLLGHEALLGRPYRTTAETLTPATVCTAAAGDLLQQMREFPDVALGFSTFLCQRIDALETMALRLGTLTARERLAAHLLSWCEGGRSERTRSFVALPLTRQELADTLGMARETLIRQLTRLSDVGAVRLTGTRIEVVDTDHLRHIAESA